jgi:hypothetical protein
MTKIAEVLLLLTALAPIAFLFGIAHLGQTGSAFLVVALGLTALCVGLMWFGQKYLYRQQAALTTVKNVDRETLSFLVAYALPLVTPSSDLSSRYALIAFIVVMILVVWQQNLLHVNPVMACFGYHFYEVSTRDGLQVLLITRRRQVALGQALEIKKIAEYVWLQP